MNTEPAKKIAVGQMILNVHDQGEGSVIPEVGIIADERKAEFAREASRRLKKLLAIVCAGLFICVSAQASIDAELPALAQKIILAESSGNPRAVGDGGRSRGLMQIQEGTWRRHTTVSWSRAFEPALNYQVGMAELRRIVRVYRARGTEPTAAHLIWTYNTGSFIKHFIPKTLKGKPHPWTLAHPNLVYRAIYKEALL